MVCCKFFCSVTSVLQVLDDYQKFGYVVGAFGLKQWVAWGVIHNEMSGVTNRQLSHTEDTKSLYPNLLCSEVITRSTQGQDVEWLLQTVARKLSHVLQGTHFVAVHFLLLAVNGGASLNPARWNEPWNSFKTRALSRWQEGKGEPAIEPSTACASECEVGEYVLEFSRCPRCQNSKRNHYSIYQIYLKTPHSLGVFCLRWVRHGSTNHRLWSSQFYPCCLFPSHMVQFLGSKVCCGGGGCVGLMTNGYGYVYVLNRYITLMSI